MTAETMSSVDTENVISKSSSVADDVPTDISHKANSSSWRIDPKESLSDWTIEIVPIDVPKEDTWSLLNDDDSSTDSHDSLKVYHVHRNILAFGEHKSNYFAALFSTNVPSANQRFTQIEVSPFALEFFPQFLDFLYGLFTAEDIRVDNAVALRHLANQFEVDSLYRYTDEYIRASLQSVDNCIKLLTAVDMFDDEELLQTIKDACASRYDPDSRDQYASLSPTLFVKIMTSSALNCESGELSVVLAAHTQKRKDGLRHLFSKDEVQFQQLTCCDRMPVVDFESALYFLRVQLVSRDALGVTCSCGAAQSLYRRCIESAANNCTRLADDGVQRDIAQMPIETQLEIHKTALQANMSECEASRKISNDSLKKSKADFRRTNEMLNEQKAALKKANKKISDHEKELKELSAYAMQDIEDSRVLKSLGIAWVDPGSSSVGTDVKEIRVCGAGIKGVDGVYILTGECNAGYPKYQKGALIDGKKEVLIFFVSEVEGSEELRWWISNNDVSKSYYGSDFTPCSNDCAPVPPANVQWDISVDGKLPNPFVTILRSAD